jgi:hypothetical protein
MASVLAPTHDLTAERISAISAKKFAEGTSKIF